MNATANWFEVDKEGLAKLLARRGKGFVVNELVQNAWDTDATEVIVTLEPVPGRPLARLKVFDDNVDGFKDLRHAFTLFAESEKKGDPTKRGRFNLGEKLVLALCEEATIRSTRGTVIFTANGRRIISKTTPRGSEFEALLRITREELAEVEAAVRLLIPPGTIRTTFNGTEIKRPAEIAGFELTLATEISDEEGQIRRTARQTVVSIHEVREGELAHIYEMGIPIVETGDRWHYNVMQKVPLNVDRDNVGPAYLQTVRAHALNVMHAKLSKEDATAPWVRDAAGHADANEAAVERVVTLRFGEKRVIADPSDPEGTKLAMSKGYTVIPPGSMSGAEWANVKHHGVAKPAGQVTPSPKPFSENGRDLKKILVEDWTPEISSTVAYCELLGRKLLNRGIVVTVANDFLWHYAATYAPGHLTLNYARLGKAFFGEISDRLNELLIHEFGHEYSGDHLSENYHDALCSLGAKLARIYLDEPQVYTSWNKTREVK
jgi:hypothetical protein